MRQDEFAEIVVVSGGTSRREHRPKSRLARMRKALAGGRDDQARKFAAILTVAKDIADHKPSALIGLIRLLGRSVQAQALLNWCEAPKSRKDCEPDETLFSPYAVITEDGRRFEDIVLDIDYKTRISLASDVILPWPWEPSRVSNSLLNLAPGGGWGTWKQDRYNHLTELWLPWRVTWVNGGNHSIAAGIAHGTGSLKPDRVCDISEVYRYVKCDGLSFIRLSDGKVIAPVSNLEMAAIFEIGRLMAPIVEALPITS